MEASNEGPKKEKYSCSRCRKLKKKCPREVPVCGHCVRVGAECSYPGRAARRTKKELEEAELRGEFIPSKKHKTHEGNGSRSNTASVIYTSDHSTFPARATRAASSTSVPPISSFQPNETVSSLISAFATLDESSSDQTSPQSIVSRQVSVDAPLSFTSANGRTLLRGDHVNRQVLSSSATQSVANSLTSPESVAASRAISSAPEYEPSFSRRLVTSSSLEPSVPVDSSSLEAETIADVFKGARATNWINADGSFKPIDRNLLDRFIAAFFKHNHRLFPVIDKLSFIDRVSTIRVFDYELLNSAFNDDVFIFQLYMIMAIGCTTLRRAGMLLKDEEELSEHLAFLSMKKFRTVMALQNIETIKCLLLLGIYSFFEPKGSSSWTISGIIMRLVIALGLNRAPVSKKLKTMPAIEVESRYRVFWSAYCFERLISTCLGRMSAIDDDEISVPLPHAMYSDEKEDIDVTNTMITLRRIAGKIYKNVHSVHAGKQDLTIEERQKIIVDLREELDGIYKLEQAKMDKQNKKSGSRKSNISFHSSESWLTMRYSQLQILLYRPSALIPKPPIESLAILGKFCLMAWKHTYTLYQKKLLPLNWITLFRTLTICNTILYCLCQWSIDLIESKIEIQQIVEILEHFGAKWIFATRCAEVFQGISNTILDISLSDGKVPNMDSLTNELFGATDAYHDILSENNVDISWVDKLALSD
ncbi:hypothetical protein KAFR_0E02330 [Kazachstania africana CBS 2517]|uniref:Zn(2)-C6 fungal-type domain-containing protein n=1 Tax=Kazachstania africana (strain ATCC 22294 / BCRC 22015 / CBS 2517 / CECT 1963 / NBRC 1671 / NRRL Y-8276) TaxID=1071382 RepID=H2AVI6_KAZAF|nr:hypothetical protein KAFR_0E02330 [Kazachstania africana CBS 2517]CCF58386.1 hypothetical protein KAFR_0E02330 [Kazachstania africana CBS 2517]